MRFPNYLFVLFLVLISCKKEKQPGIVEQASIEPSITHLDSLLNNMLNCWFPAVMDTNNGGFYTNFEYNWRLSDNQPKNLLNHARGIWTASKAAGFYKNNPMYLEAATHGYNYLVKNFWDNEIGGFHSSSKSKPIGEYKNAYDNSFVIFALAEYAKMNDDPAIKEWLNNSFNWFENNVHDSIYGGYNHFVFPENNMNSQNSIDYKTETGWGETDWKNQNTSIHIMEAFTNLYQVIPEEKVRKRLEEIFLLIRDKMVHKNGHLQLYFLPDWTPISHKDSSRNYILENKRYDHISFGHDIETAYLLIETAEALYDKPDSITLQIAKKLTDHSLQYGMDNNNYGMFYEGYRFNGSNEVEIINEQKSWWVQAEAWHAFAVMQHYFPEEEKYKIAHKNMWKYIDEQMIDKSYGGWFNFGLDNNPENEKSKKGHSWKTAYHNGRALMQVIQYRRENLIK